MDNFRNLEGASFASVLTTLRVQARGVMLVALARAGRLADRGYPASVNVLEYVLDSDEIERILRQQGRVPAGVDIRNFHQDLASRKWSWVSNEARNRTLVEDFEIPTDDPTSVLEFRGVVRLETWGDSSQNTSKALYSDSQGRKYMKALVADRSMMGGGSAITLFAEDGARFATYENIRELWKDWLASLKGDGKLFVVQEGQFMSPDGREMLSSIVEGKEIYNIAVVHGASLTNPKSPKTSGVVPGLDPDKRVGGFPDLFIFLTKEQAALWKVRFPDCEGITSIPLECRRSAIARTSRNSDRVVSVASLVPLKKVNELIEAFSLIADKNPTATLEVFGEGTERSKLEEQIHRLGLEHRISLPGYVDNASDRFKGAAVSVISSEREAGATPISESMSVGTPVVAYDIDYAPRNLFEDGVSGYLVPPGDVKQLSEAIDKALQKNAETENLREAAFDASKKFSPEVVTDRFLEEAEKLVDLRS